MIAWSKTFPRWKYPLGYSRLRDANLRLRNRIGLKKANGRWKLGLVTGDTHRLEAFRNKHQGKRCFILGNGPSLAKTPVERLQNEITIGTNGLYKAFPEWGFSTNYLLFEDVAQTELRGPDIPNIKGPTMLAAAHNAHSIPRPWNDLCFMNVRLADKNYWDDIGIQFSKDFANIVYLGSTITYIALQWAYHLGCDPVYLVGVDFDYGPLSQIFEPGKIVIGEKELDLIRQTHFSTEYYKVGDVIGVPHSDLQLRAFEVAKANYEAAGRSIFNATLGGKLEVYERVAFNSLFEPVHA